MHLENNSGLSGVEASSRFEVGDKVILIQPSSWENIPDQATGVVTKIRDEARIEVEWTGEHAHCQPSVFWAWRFAKEGEQEVIKPTPSNVHVLYQPKVNDRVILKHADNTTKQAGMKGTVTSVSEAHCLVQWDGLSYNEVCYRWRLAKDESDPKGTSTRVDADPALTLFSGYLTPKLASHSLSSVKYRACRKVLLARCMWARKHPDETVVVYYTRLSGAEYLRYCQAALLKLRVQYKTREIIGVTSLAIKDYTVAATRRRKRWAEKKSH